MTGNNVTNGIVPKGRAQFIIFRDGKILMARHRANGEEYYCIPDGGIEEGETPEEAAA